MEVSIIILFLIELYLEYPSLDYIMLNISGLYFKGSLYENLRKYW